MVSGDTKPLARVPPGFPGICVTFCCLYTWAFLSMPRTLTITANTKLRALDHEALREKAAACGMNVSAYLRILVLEDLTSNASNLLQTVESEHTRLIILAAQHGQELTPQLMKSLRAEAIVRAQALVENTLRLLKQRSSFDAI